MYIIKGLNLLIKIALHSQVGCTKVNSQSIARETDCMLYVGSIYALSYYPLTLWMRHDFDTPPPPKKGLPGLGGLS